MIPVTHKKAVLCPFPPLHLILSSRSSMTQCFPSADLELVELDFDSQLYPLLSVCATIISYLPLSLGVSGLTCVTTRANRDDYLGTVAVGCVMLEVEMGGVNTRWSLFSWLPGLGRETDKPVDNDTDDTGVRKVQKHAGL